MKLDSREKHRENDFPQPQIVELPKQPEIIPITPKDVSIRRIDIKRLVEDDEKRWWEQETPQARI